MKTIIIKRQLHNGESRLTLSFEYDADLIRTIRNVENARWSNTMKCWYLPFDEATLRKVLAVFHNKVEFDISSIASTVEMKKVSSTNMVEAVKSAIPDNDKEFFIDFTPWTIRNPLEKEKKPAQFGPVKFSINETDGRLVIKFLGKYDPDWIKEISSYGKAHYDKERREWLLQWSQLAVDSYPTILPRKALR
jgi:hypothetical protein